MVAEIAGHGGADGERERGVRLAGADEHVVEHSQVGEQFLSETIAVRAGAGSLIAATGMAPIVILIERSIQLLTWWAILGSNQ